MMTARPLLFAALLCLILALPTQTIVLAQGETCPESPVAQLSDAVVTGAPRSLYAEPTAESDVLQVIDPGAVVNVLNRDSCVDGELWRGVVYNGVVGYMRENDPDGVALAPYVEPDPVQVSVPGRRISDIKSDVLVAQYSTALASGVTMQYRIGYTYPDAMSPHPNFYLFQFRDYIRPPEYRFREPRIAVYAIPEWTFHEGASNRIRQLRGYLDARPPLPLTEEETGEPVSAPMLPYPAAAQFFAAQQKYIDFRNGAGLRYLTYTAQMTGEINPLGIFYKFQGITEDGQVYVTAEFPVLVPEDVFPVYDHDAYIAAGIDDSPINDYYQGYLDELTANLNAIEDYQTLPGLQTLDAFMQSIYLPPWPEANDG